MAKRTITAPLEITIYEGDPGEGVLFWLDGGGTSMINGERHSFGIAGAALVAYLPGERAVTINVEQIILAGLADKP